MTKQALILGGVSWDTMLYVDAFPQPAPQTLFTRAYHDTVGSTGSGKALNMRRLDFDLTLYGMLGEDYYGERIAEYFARGGIPFVYDITSQGTERHVNLMDDAGKRISIISRSGGSPDKVDLVRADAMIQQSGYIVLNIVDYCRPIIPVIKRHNKAIWTDLHDYDGTNPYHQDFIDAADYIFLSSDSLPDYRRFMERLIAGGKQLVVCTHGSAGSTALTALGEWIETPAITAYTRVDTNGAGDAFFSGFLYGHSKGYSTMVCLQMATIAAGLSVTSYELASPELSPVRLQAEYREHYGPLT
ncbi:MAG: carbohydrate kinase family protein [Chloroflexota bacterium]